MAIPFNLPTDEQAEDNYRRLDQLLVDLYSVLRQILFRPTCVPQFVSNRNGEPGDEGRLQPAPTSDVSGSRRADLPDVVSSTLSAPCSHCPCRRRRHRRRRRASSCCTGESESPSTGGQSQRVERPLGRPQREEDQWLIVGEQLRKIAEEFRMTFRKPEMAKEETEQRDLRMEVKTTGLFSLLVPAHFRSSIWTTVILLVGWRLLTRAR